MIQVEQRGSYLKIQQNGGFIRIKGPYVNYIGYEGYGSWVRKGENLYLQLGEEGTEVWVNDVLVGVFSIHLKSQTIGKVPVYGEVNGYGKVIEAFQNLIKENLKIFLHPSPGWPIQVIKNFQTHDYWPSGREEIHITQEEIFFPFNLTHELGHHIDLHLESKKKKEVRMRWWELKREGVRLEMLSEAHVFGLYPLEIGKAEEDPAEMFASAVSAAALAPKESDAYKLAQEVLKGIVEIPRV
ncbi:MAG: hypothetical protein GXN92_01845 [Candidatus Micrarchaeota archaeon]|nr:hypothetical protein [Candidatus Micrarchaeota archaeon]